MSPECEPTHTHTHTHTHRENTLRNTLMCVKKHFSARLKSLEFVWRESEPSSVKLVTSEGGRLKKSLFFNVVFVLEDGARLKFDFFSWSSQKRVLSERWWKSKDGSCHLDIFSHNSVSTKSQLTCRFIRTNSVTGELTPGWRRSWSGAESSGRSYRNMTKYSVSPLLTLTDFSRSNKPSAYLCVSIRESVCARACVWLCTFARTHTQTVVLVTSEALWPPFSVWNQKKEK